MLESILYLLVWVIVAAIVFYAVIWVLGIVGVTVPERIKQLLAALLVLLILIWFVGAMTGYGPPFPQHRF